MLKLGIDDSGRGPIIGPMVLAGCLIDELIEKEFKNLGVKDSKQLTPKRREVLADIIKEKAIKYWVVIVHPDEIDGRAGNGLNLNQIEAIKSSEIINKINENINQIEVAVDCPSPNIESWKGYLERFIKNPDNLKLKVEHKADKNHISCSAASILAKTTRDKEIEKIKKKIGKDFGSGYTSDPVTQKFIKEYSKKHEKDGIFRQTWATWSNHKKEQEQKKLDFK